jgi:iron(III) transport system substrate-binding protein
MQIFKKFSFFAIIAILFSSCAGEGSTEEKNEVNVYTHRHYDSDKQLFELFTEQTGIKVNVLKASADELMVRMRQEGENSPADILFTVDAGNLVKAQFNDLLQPVKNEVILNNVPEHLRDEQLHWFGLTKRARVIVVDKNYPLKDSIKNYEDLANRIHQGSVIMRSSSNVYNQSLLASLIAHNGEDAGISWVKNVMVNMAREPKGSDRDQIKNIASGQGSISVVNTYYLGQMENSENGEEREALQQIEVIYPNQSGRGMHVNISGVGVAKHAPNFENAVKLIEFLTEVEAQSILAKSNYEYPVNSNVEFDGGSFPIGKFVQDSLPVYILGKYNELAVKQFDMVGWK